MRIRFVHAADIHLGYVQYNQLKRADDFARAFLAVVDHAIAVRADFVLLAGDLFHRASADAWMLKQAWVGLTRLRDERIPVVAVEGNHDAQNVRKNLSWMEYLCDQELLYLLNIQTGAGEHKSLVPWSEEHRRGSYLDLAGARIYGMKYYGATTGRNLDQIKYDIEPGPNGYTIFMLHAGLEGQVPHLHGGLSRGQLELLHPHVDYVALGHIHKRLLEDWVFNPGSTETNSFGELEWPHGFLDVQVDTEATPKHAVSAIPTPTLRPFHRIAVNCDSSPSLESFMASVTETIERRRGIPAGAVLELQLGGVAEFRRQDVPLEQLKGMLEIAFNPLVARVRNNLVPPGVVSVRGGERTPRAELERQVVEGLIYQNGDHRPRTAEWARLVLNVKNMASEGQLPATIVDHMRRALAEMKEQASAESPEARTMVAAEAE